MIKNGNLYCDFCHKSLRAKGEGRGSVKAITQHAGKKKKTFCNWSCAYQGALKRASESKRSLAHLSMNERKELKTRLGYANLQTATRLLNRSKVNGKKFTEIALCDDPSTRRDEFYKLFKFENDADILWIRLMHWRFNYTEQDILDHMWDTAEEVHKAYGMTN